MHEESEVLEVSIQKVKKAVLKSFEHDNVLIVLFGSRARGNAHRTSDIDVGILPYGECDRRKVAALRAEFEEMNIPYTVDLVNLADVPDDFRQKVLAEGAIWKESIN